jgi:hypothetical protein
LTGSELLLVLETDQTLIQADSPNRWERGLAFERDLVLLDADVDLESLSSFTRAGHLQGIFHWEGAGCAEFEQAVIAKQNCFKVEAELDLNPLVFASISPGLGFALLIEHAMAGVDSPLFTDVGVARG